MGLEHVLELALELGLELELELILELRQRRNIRSKEGCEKKCKQHELYGSPRRKLG